MSHSFDRPARSGRPRSPRRADIRVLHFPPGTSAWPRPLGARPAGKEPPTTPIRGPAPPGPTKPADPSGPSLRLIGPRAD